MKKNGALALVFLALTVFSGVAQATGTPAEVCGTAVTDEVWRTTIKNSVAYFDRVAWDATSGSYASEITLQGSHRSETRHLIALSRMIYGLSHTAYLNPENLTRARSVATFLRGKMMKKDRHGPYFVRAVDKKGKEVPVEGKDPNILIVNEQAYGLNGLVALYQVSPDDDLKGLIDDTTRAFIRRFHDDSKKSFFDTYDLTSGRNGKTKSYNSTVYVATAFLLELAMTSPEMMEKYRDLITELADIVAAYFIDQKTGWIVENFDAGWRQDWRDWQKQDSGTVGIAGHNFQAAWFLMRASELCDRHDGKVALYREKAKYILEQMLTRGAVDKQKGGVFDAFNRETSKPQWNQNKAWWQQAEAILALTEALRLGVLDTPEALQARDGIVDFFLEHFLDRDDGGEFAIVGPRGEKVSDTETAGKGNAGKSTYHTVELGRYMLGYSRTDFKNTLLRRRIQQFFGNYPLQWDQFVAEQSKLLRPEMVTEVNNFGLPTFYQTRDGYFQSIQDWGAQFEIEGFSYDVLPDMGPNGSVAVRCHGTIKLKGAKPKVYPDNKHEWTEYFEFDEKGDIKRLTVNMNLK